MTAVVTSNDSDHLLIQQTIQLCLAMHIGWGHGGDYSHWHKDNSEEKDRSEQFSKDLKILFPLKSAQNLTAKCHPLDLLTVMLKHSRYLYIYFL